MTGGTPSSGSLHLGQLQSAWGKWWSIIGFWGARFAEKTISHLLTPETAETLCGKFGIILWYVLVIHGGTWSPINYWPVTVYLWYSMTLAMPRPEQTWILISWRQQQRTIEWSTIGQTAGLFKGILARWHEDNAQAFRWFCWTLCFFRTLFWPVYMAGGSVWESLL